jgi:hypothetical protein
MGDGLSAAEWHVVAASVQGVSHRRAGMPCQDACCWEALPGGKLVAAVADGAGSAAHADIGASLAAETVVKWFTRHCAGGAPENEAGIRALLLDALRATADALAAAARASGVELREMATTLIVVLAASDWIAAAQVGDGAAVYSDFADGLYALTVPPEAEYANETVFLTSPDALETAQYILKHGRIAQFALFSDGLQRLALRLPEGEPHPPFFMPLLRFAADADSGDLARQQLAAFLTSPRIAERADDDLTLLLATLKHASAT